LIFGRTKPKPETKPIQDFIDEKLRDLSNLFPSEAFLLIVSNTKWHGNIASGHTSASIDGNKDKNIPIVPTAGESYGIVVRKDSGDGYLGVAVILNGKILSSGETDADTVQITPIVTLSTRSSKSTLSNPSTPINPPTTSISASEEQDNCDSSYPDFCIASPPPNLNCPDISQKRFTVSGSDPHGFDRDNDGIGES
jgi:hypothetical protein